MKNEKQSTERSYSRYLMGASLIALTLLFLGAGKMSDNMQSRALELENMKKNCTESVEQLWKAIPAEHQTAWTRLVAENPQLCFKASHYALKPLGSQ